VTTNPPEAQRPAALRVAADLMAANPPAVQPSTPVGDVARLLVERHLSGVPVVAQSGEVLGVVTQVDLIARHAHVHLPLYLNVLGGLIPLGGERRFREEVRRITGRQAADVMTTEPYAVEADTPLEDIATRMAEHEADPALVLSQGRLVGLITRADLVRLVVLEDQEQVPGG
jgi:CBS domain-containing protein